MNVAFAGTPEFAVAILQTLHQKVNVTAVYTQPDNNKGRGRKLHQSAVKEYALANHLTLFQPTKITTAVDALKKTDVMIVVAYGQILPTAILNAPKYGCVNIHASLLPRWRGAAPIERAILAGDKQTGISIMQMDKGLDSGDIINQQKCLISATDNPKTLSDKLLDIAQTLIIDTLTKLPQQGLTPSQPQSQIGINYAHKLTKNEAWIDWQQDITQIEQQIRAFNPYPIAQCYAKSNRFKKEVVRILTAQILDNNNHQHAYGSIVNQSKQGIDVACKNGILRINTLQLASKKPLLARDFINAYSLQQLF